jgi:carbamoyltransferase
LGLLYAAFTYYLGFRVNGGEYKLMGLAPYGQPDSERVRRFEEKIFSHLLDLRPDGSFLLNMPYFRFATGLRMTQDRKWEKLFELPRREAESAITQAHHDLALAIQQATEKVIFRLAETARELTQCPRLVLAGGVALNSVANGKLLRSGLLDDLWLPPSPGDAGGAIGATYAAWHIGLNQPRTVQADPGPMQQVYLGPDFSEKDIRQCLQRAGASYHYYAEEQQLLTEVARRLQAGQVVGWFQGRMEMGARALGNRSILADASQPDMQARLNRSIKRRESFRPFAPAVLAEDAAEYFELDRPSPYMQLVVPVREQHTARFPAITHVDGSARVQSVQESDNPRFWQLLQAFKSRTGTGMLVNTSFNVRGEPMVCSPQDAHRCYLSTDIDCLVMGNFLLSKTNPETKPANPG